MHTIIHLLSIVMAIQYNNDDDDDDDDNDDH